MNEVEKRLKEILSYKTIRKIFDALDEGIIIVDRDYNIIFYNNTLTRFEGLESKNVIGKKLLEVFPSLTPEESTIYQVIETGRPIFNRYQQYLNYKGMEIRTLNTTIPIVENGQVLGALEISRDVSEVYALSQKVLELQQKLIGKKPRSINVGLKYSFDSIVGSSKKIREIVEVLKKVAGTTSSVLIYGETGTGKELFAQSIHSESPRKNRPFIAQNCAALPETLLESLLFGTTKGSFTGAEDKPGLFEQADGGTLLLDEINCMGLSLQSKLLRVLQEGVVRRIGATFDIPVDVRIIATTNEKPSELLKSGRLRSDLFYRLSVIYVEIPPLRERPEDIEELVSFFIKKYNAKFGKDVKGVDRQVLNIFREYPWPGNVRELEHVIEGVMNYVDGGYILTGDLKYLSFGSFRDYIEKKPDPAIGVKSRVDEYEKDLILNALRSTGGNITRAAQKLGIKRQSLQYRMKKYGITKEL
ncbi:sigma-54 interaction domain-containing protein [Thermosediminibacter oceani]|uniref:PAS modulated sigma54 specific transcriptional regulator, Fis family n=1 Tax=Thermosediminibacter oceani (strain ATCC BAA-1034 / DSM 16646 / JW/IW-1228P) TaxID=555079 RepID=D9RZU4_THEOJ|nr:sigma-54-dependent Fis family transcriptional regulator [Thermosediminibacter oceani]ADL08721.1 PAS modulated sigma54 specific transcriptional regulator, Fis family [Thermosediminibacter oceani DSM 16646]